MNQNDYFLWLLLNTNFKIIHLTLKGLSLSFCGKLSEMATANVLRRDSVR